MDIALSLAALFFLCLFFAGFKGIGGGLAPLLALSSAMVWFSLWGMAGQLVLGGWLFYIASIALGAAAFVRDGAQPLKSLFGPGFCLFFGMALVALVYFALRQPVFSVWDEFNSWGLAAKLVKQNNALYPAATTGFWWTMTERPALVVLSYFVQFFSAAFAPWKVYWAYSLLYFAAAAALVGSLDWRRWRLAGLVGVVGLLCPFFFNNYYHTVQISKTYLSAYGDLPAGFLFGGCLLVYYHTRAAGKGVLWAAAFPLAALALSKENVFPLALVAAGVMAADCLFFGTGRAGFAGARLQPAKAAAKPKGAFWQKAGPRALAAAGYFAAAVVPSALWGRYAGWAHVTYNEYMRGNSTNRSVSEGVVQALRELLGLAPPSEAYVQARDGLIDSFLGRQAVEGGYQNGVIKTSMAGTQLITLLLMLAVFAAAVLLAKNAHQRKRVALAGGLMLGGFFAYHFELLVTYGFLSHTREEVGVFDYVRYITTYNVAFFMLGLLLLAYAAKWGGGGRGRLSRLLMLGLALFMMLRTALLIRPGYSVLDYPEDTYRTEQAEEAAAMQMAEQMEPGSHVFFVAQQGDGSQYFRWHYHLQPIVLEYSIRGGDRLAPPPEGVQLSPEEEEVTSYASLRRVTEYIEKYNCRYLLIDSLDEGFAGDYGVLFKEAPSVDMELPALYERGEDGLYYQTV